MISPFQRRFTIFLFLLVVAIFLNIHHLEAMPKMYFRHGAVASAKTLNLVAVAHNYRTQGKPVVILKPAMDVRFSVTEVRSRAGLSEKADFLVRPDTDILKLALNQSEKIYCVLVDEAQFLNPTQIDQLRLATVTWNVPVICYGLRTDFRTNLVYTLYALYTPYTL